jgi:hypothetical protein
MTGPALNLINKIFKADYATVQPKIIQTHKFEILVSFGNPEKGRILLKFANALTRKSGWEPSVTALHFSPTNDVSNYNIEEYEKESFSPIIDEASVLDQKIVTLFRISTDITTDIIETANVGKFDLLLLGPGQSIYEGSLLGKIFGFTSKIFNPDRLINTVTGKERLFQSSPFDDKIRLILTKCNNPVGILIDRNLSEFNNIVVTFTSAEDAFLLKYAQKLVENSSSNISLLPISSMLFNNNELNQSINSFKIEYPDNYTTITEQEADSKYLNYADLIIISMNGWMKLVNLKKAWVKNIPSIFVVKN